MTIYTKLQKFSKFTARVLLTIVFLLDSWQGSIGGGRHVCALAGGTSAERCSSTKVSELYSCIEDDVTLDWRHFKKSEALFESRPACGAISQGV